MAQTILNSSLIDLKNENNEEKIPINISLSSSSGQNESSFSQKEEDSNIIILPENDNLINDFSEEFGPLLRLFNEKSPIDIPISQINQSNISIDDNISIEKSSSFYNIKQFDNLNDSNELESIYMWPNSFRLNENEEKLSGDSFSSSFEIHPNQEIDILEMNEFYLNSSDGKNNSIIEFNNIKYPVEEINEKSKNSQIDEKKKTKINFLISKNNKNEINLENNKTLSEDKKNIENIQRQYIGKKRGDEKKNPSLFQKNKLKNHLREINKVTVINSKAFKCECGKVFSTEENQRLHYINIHLHKKPYNCSFCGEGFSHRNGKIYHERVYHTFIFPYKCELCSSAFASKSAMVYHMKSKHKIN